jgi:hypothetical protein
MVNPLAGFGSGRRRRTQQGNRRWFCALVIFQSEFAPRPARQNRVEAVIFRREERIDGRFAVARRGDQLGGIVGCLEFLVVPDLGLLTCAPLLGLCPRVRAVDGFSVHLQPIADLQPRRDGTLVQRPSWVDVSPEAQTLHITESETILLSTRESPCAVSTSGKKYTPPRRGNLFSAYSSAAFLITRTV